jgi:hypothetical protein
MHYLEENKLRVNNTFLFILEVLIESHKKINELVAESKTFDAADKLWKSFQDKIQDFVNQQGGQTHKGEPIIGRPNWNEVKDFLNGQRTLESIIGCN